MARACARISEPGRGSLPRGPEPAAGRYDSVARRVARVRRWAIRDRAEGTSAREPGAVSRTSVLSMRARGSVDTQAPVRGYFMWVGGALLVLLFAANSLLPAPSPNKLIESHSTLPPIRIASELKGPEAVIIDTSQPGFPILPDRKIAVPSPLTSDAADAVRRPPASISEQADASDGSPAIPTHVRETLAQLDPGVSDQADSSTRPVGLASEPRRNFAHTRSGERRRPGRHSSFDTTPEWCASLRQGSCR
ncbi:hypothetical protein ABIE91_003065 [Bradyrhizobium elkanii]